MTNGKKLAISLARNVLKFLLCNIKGISVPLCTIYSYVLLTMRDSIWFHSVSSHMIYDSSGT